MIRIPGTTARYLVRDRTLYVFCRGTSSDDPWWRNLLLRRVRFADWRVNAADLREAERVHAALPTGLEYDRVEVRGFSRGAAVATLVAVFRGAMFLHLDAPKRAVCRRAVRWIRDYMFFETHAYRCDIIPLLPFWHASWRCKWSGWTWPWKAHEKAGRDAARWRHEISRG